MPINRKKFSKVYFDKFDLQIQELFFLINQISSNIKLNKKDYTLLKKDVLYYLKKIKSKNKLGDNNKKFFLLGSTANTYNKIAACSHGSQKSKNIIFCHEGFSGFVRANHIKINDLMYCDIYVHPGNYFFKKKKESSYLNLNKKKINSFSINFIKKLPILNINPIHKSFTKLKILYVPSRIENYQSNGAMALNVKAYKKWQIKLLSKYKNIFIKPHPKQIKYYSFEFPNSRIVNGNLKEIVNQYDCILFDAISSNAFADVVVSDRQIIYLDIGLSFFTDAGKELLNKRVHTIKINFDNQFDGLKKISKIYLKSKTNEFSYCFCYSEKKNFIDNFRNII